MFINQAYQGRHEWWRYLIGTAIIFVLFFLGQLPLGIILILKSRGITGGDMEHTTSALVKASGLSPNMFTFLLLTSFVIGFAGVWLVAKYIHNLTLKKIATTRLKFDWKRFFVSFSLVGVYIIASIIIEYYSNPEDFEIQFQLIPFLILLAIAVPLVPIQTAFEEFLFRGYLMQGFGILAKNRWFPLLLTSLIFGSLHLANPEVSQFGNNIMFYYIGTGLFLGILTLMDQGLELSWGFHTANNLIQILLVTAEWSAFQSESVLKDLSNPTGMGSEIIFSLLIFYPILILIFSRIYKWNNWKEKLLGKVTPPELPTEH